jgi:ethanolamine ammonia-lyase small subunit
MGSLKPRDDDLDRSAFLEQVRERTPARILVGRAGPAYRTDTSLALRADHSAALDAVRAEVHLERDLSPELVQRYEIFEVRSRVRSRDEYLRRPDLGRLLDDESMQELAKQATPGADLQVVIGDGLSAAAVVAQAPSLVPLLAAGAGVRNWRFGRPFFVRNCRVGILNAVGESLGPTVVVLLIGERPGLATAESLSAYMAFRPRLGHTDAQRNLISNIHARGVDVVSAIERIFSLAEQMRIAEKSGVEIKERPTLRR